jgi:hypothetical protein
MGKENLRPMGSVVLLLPSATEQTLPLTDVDICEDPKKLKREWETPTEVATV